MSKILLAICTAVAVGAIGTGPLCAQPDVLERLTESRLGAIQPGEYVGGDRIRFELGVQGANYLLRFAGDREVFALYSDRISFGGRVLRYDSGETAIRVAGWGAMTLYTDSSPNGLPTTRISDATIASPSGISTGEMESLAADEGQHLAYARRLRITFTADWSVLETNSALRAAALDAMLNAARGIERFTRAEQSRDIMGNRISAVTLATARRPTLSLHDRTLIVTFNPDQGFFGRASSRAIARALGVLLGRTHQ